MKVIVISSYAILREGIISIISGLSNISIVLNAETAREAMFMIKSNSADAVILDTHEDNEEELKAIDDIIEAGGNIKLIVLDFHGNNELFLRSLRYSIEGYILGKEQEEGIIYAIKQISRGKKFFDSYFVDCMMNKSKYVGG